MQSSTDLVTEKVRQHPAVNIVSSLCLMHSVSGSWFTCFYMFYMFFFLWADPVSWTVQNRTLLLCKTWANRVVSWLWKLLYLLLLLHGCYQLYEGSMLYLRLTHFWKMTNMFPLSELTFWWGHTVRFHLLNVCLTVDIVLICFLMETTKRSVVKWTMQQRDIPTHCQHHIYSQNLLHTAQHLYAVSEHSMVKG